MNRKGFTLLEILIVVAIIAVLVAVLVPIAVNQMEKADITRAWADVNAIETAVTNFRSDTKEFPTRDNSGHSNIEDVLYTGETWASHGETFASGVGYGNNQDRMWYHFNTNDNDRYPTWDSTALIGWHGPYLDRDPLDPWGHMYILSTYAMTHPSGGTTYYSWILSAGPNGEFQTDDTVNTLQGDDIGKWIYEWPQ